VPTIADTHEGFVIKAVLDRRNVTIDEMVECLEDVRALQATSIVSDRVY
jgi:hypothetical protein